MTALVVLTCDHPMEGGTCALRLFESFPLEYAVAQARRAGWHVTDGGGALCPAHRGGGPR